MVNLYRSIDQPMKILGARDNSNLAMSLIDKLGINKSQNNQPIITWEVLGLHMGVLTKEALSWSPDIENPSAGDVESFKHSNIFSPVL